MHSDVVSVTYLQHLIQAFLHQIALHLQPLPRTAPLPQIVPRLHHQTDLLLLLCLTGIPLPENDQMVLRYHCFHISLILALYSQYNLNKSDPKTAWCYAQGLYQEPGPTQESEVPCPYISRNSRTCSLKAI